MAKNKPKIGDAVLHHGRPQLITGFQVRARLVDEKVVKFPITIFFVDYERDPTMLREKPFTDRKTGEKGVRRWGKYGNKCNTPDLKWSDEIGGWYLPGRVLSYDERLAYEALVGARPRPDHGPVPLRLLDQTDLADIEVHAGDETRGPSSLVQVVKKHKIGRMKDALSGEWVETEEDWNARAAAYAIACLEHCAEVRAVRQGEVTHV